MEVEIWPRTWFVLEQNRDTEQLRIDKSRFTQYLTLNLYESAEEPEEIHHRFLSNLRLDFDVGKDHSPDANEESPHSFELLYAYYQADRLWNTLDLRLGRQVLMDYYNQSAMDGLWFQFRRNWFFGVDAYVGLEVKKDYSGERKGLWLPNPPNRQDDGILESRHVGALFGGSLFLDNLKDTDLRVGYKGGYDGEQQKMLFTATARQRLFQEIWEIYGLAAYDMIFERMQDLSIGTSVQAAGFSADLGHNHHAPRFDADSLFNFFDVTLHNELYANLAYDLDALTRFRAGYHHYTHTTSDPFTTRWGDGGNADDELFLNASRRLFASWDIRAGYQFNTGWSGERHEMNLGTGAFVWERYLKLDGYFACAWYKKLTYIDLLETDINQNIAWTLAGEAEIFFRPDITLRINGDVSANQLMERQFSLFTLLAVHGWFGG